MKYNFGIITCKDIDAEDEKDAINKARELCKNNPRISCITITSPDGEFYAEVDENTKEAK